jgi:ribonuclease HII
VVAGACAYLVDALISGVTDSKQINEKDRETVYENLRKAKGVIWATASVDHKRIDEINILQATFEAMSQSVLSVIDQLSGRFRSPRFHVLIDGNKVPPQLKHLNCTAVVKGDAREFIIAAASVFAKVTRDRIMYDLDTKFPVYGFKQHKGYPTGDHCRAISQHGPCPYHRLTFAPLKTMNLTAKKKPATVKQKLPASGEGSLFVKSAIGQVRRSARLCPRGA